MSMRVRSRREWPTVTNANKGRAGEGVKVK